MQKFGLQRNSSATHLGVELEIRKEQASALGRAGKKLRLSIEQYEKVSSADSEQQHDLLLKEIARNVWELILQREFIGFVEGNLDWINANYKIPDQAMALLGTT